jgi:acetylornithine deacetylase/succinyl-diaminopimelate desuccinylase-like protein
MLASLTDEHGRVTVPGFYDRVKELTSEERETYAGISFDEEEWRASVGVKAPTPGEPGYTLLERLSARPTFDINGLWGGYSGEGSKTIIPAFAAAKFSSRLVPDQDHEEIERLTVEHLHRIAPPTVELDVKIIHGGQPVITPRDHPGVALAAEALRQAFGKETVFHRSGGSIPVVPALDKHLGLKTVMVGFSSPNGNFHAPNEWMPLGNYRTGMDAIVRMWGLFGDTTAAELRGG